MGAHQILILGSDPKIAPLTLVGDMPTMTAFCRVWRAVCVFRPWVRLPSGQARCCPELFYRAGRPAASGSRDEFSRKVGLPLDHVAALRRPPGGHASVGRLGRSPGGTKPHLLAPVEACGHSISSHGQVVAQRRSAEAGLPLRGFPWTMPPELQLQHGQACPCGASLGPCHPSSIVNRKSNPSDFRPCRKRPFGYNGRVNSPEQLP